MTKLLNWFTSEHFSKVLIGLGALILILSALLFLYNNIHFNTQQSINGQLFEQYGTFIAGAVGSFWALAGVLLFYVALKDQRADFKTNKDTLETEVKALEEQAKALQLQAEQLELQKQELRLNTEELKGQKEEFKKQNETLTKQHETLTQQQFETTFFNLLSMLSEVRNSIIIEDMGAATFKNYIGRDAFKIMGNKLKIFYSNLKDIEIRYNSNDLGDLDRQIISDYKVEHVSDIFLPENISKAAFIKLYNSYYSSLDHYFKSLYQLLNFLSYKEHYDYALAYAENHLINDYTYKSKEQLIKWKYQRYAGYIQAQMSSSEMLLLFYDALFYPKMKRLVYHYDLLENLNTENLLNSKYDTNFYSGESFSFGDDNLPNTKRYDAIEFKSRDEILKL